ncbi:MAG: NUDIX hydrolase [Alphaproteobacteria bacterium]|nr:MAG: NUDIX hydrolase [Alphaproteobacteria bacterium]
MRAKTILIAGPYRSGTGGDPILIERNLRALEQAALAVYDKGHFPLIGEWAALPLAHATGATIPGAIPQAFLYEVAQRMLRQCHAVYRIAGESRGADMDVQTARQQGLPVYVDLDDIPPGARSR